MTAVKEAPLDHYRIVQFATHGLLSSETAGFGRAAEGALVLTPPATATDKDDGLLTASEVAQLKLNADWVVLSACNTAAGDKPGAEPLSGLASASFMPAPALSLSRTGMSIRTPRRRSPPALLRLWRRNRQSAMPRRSANPCLQ